MNRLMQRAASLATFLAVAIVLAGAAAGQVSPDLYAGLQWRSIGPFHGGRVAAIGGAIGEPGTFYAGLPQGGIWKTTSGGTDWFPVFDQVATVDSIGAISVAPSNPNIIYAGSGDAVEHEARNGEGGDGMYKSTDAGKTWTHIGLEGTYKIPRIVVDPKNPDIVLVAAMSGLHGSQRGVFRTDDGGATWSNTLTLDAVTGARDIAAPFDMPNVVFATTVADGAETGPGGRGGGGGGRGGAAAGPSRTKLFRSLDEGKTWSEIANDPETTGRSSVAVAMNTNGRRVFVIGGAGLFRSDDQGATWRHMAAGISGNQYICGVWVDPKNPDVLYTMSTASYKSTDGGESFTPFKGAPGGEDMHEAWIDPTDGKRIAFGNDQGAAVTFDGGENWSSYYNLPVAQLYHISTDTRYPYWAMASQQDTGAIMVRNRGDVGDISEVDWMPLPSSERGTVTADPIDPEIIYGVGYGAAGGGSGLVKINLRTGQWENSAPNYGADASKYRSGDATRRLADPFDPHSIYWDMQCVLVTHDQGHSWRPISPDLTTPKGQPEVPCGTAPAPAAGRAGAAAAPPAGGGGRGGGLSLADFSVSTLQKGVFWTVSSNGQIYNNLDGLHWTNVSNVPDADVTFNSIEASHTDLKTAYISGVPNAGRGATAAEDTNVPLIWRTHNGGQTWTKIVVGLPSDETSGSWVNVLREDPKQKGLLFAGTETTVFVSFDDGDHWQSLRQNLPSTSIRDMVFHTNDGMNDLVIGTFGRGFWVLDDMSPLREVAAKGAAIAAAPAYLFKPGDAIRARVSDNWDQPINRELPHSDNPPYGAIFYYHLSRPPGGEIKLEISDAAGRLVRTIASVPPELPASWPYPGYWVGTPADLALGTKTGTNRFNWDLRYDDPPAFSLDLENQMNVAPGGFVTPGPHGPQVIPGIYTMKLTVDGQTYSQTVRVRNDPRVGEGPRVMADLREKNRLIMLAYHAAKESYRGNTEVAAVRQQVTALTRGQLPTDVATAATAFDARLATFGGVTPGRGGRGGGGGGFGGRGGAAAAPGGVIAFNALNGEFDGMISTQQVGIDEAPTQAEIDTWEADCANYNATVDAWKTVQGQELATLNGLLTRDNQPPLHITPTTLTAATCHFAPPSAPAAAKSGRSGK